MSMVNFQGNSLISYLNQFTDGKSHNDKSITFEIPNAREFYFEFNITFIIKKEQKLVN